MPDDDLPQLGTCCTCGTSEGVRNIVMLDRRGPVPGQGWACLVCGLPPDGAVAVLCDACAALDGPPKFVCDGYPARGKRVPYDELPPGVFEHDPEMHAEDDNMTERTPLTMWVIYDHPDDRPDHFVARKWLGETPTSEVMLGKTLNEVRRAIPLGMHRLDRWELDDPKIVEVWL